MHLLPPHLRNGIDFDSSYDVPKDCLEELPDDDYDPAQRAAKRRRVETIAKHYLRGRAPLILSARLKGAFNNGWKNPWIQAQGEVNRNPGRLEREASYHAPGAVEHVKHTGDVRRASPGRSEGGSFVPFPEAPRVAEPPLPTRAAEKRHDRTVPISRKWQHRTKPTGVCRVDAEPPARLKSADSKPRWLRRPAMACPDPERSEHTNTDLSPTRTRNGCRPPGVHGELQLTAPKAPLRAAHPDPTQERENNTQLNLYASASMAISSPVTPAIVGHNPYGEGPRSVRPTAARRTRASNVTSLPQPVVTRMDSSIAQADSNSSKFHKTSRGSKTPQVTQAPEPRMALISVNESSTTPFEILTGMGLTQRPPTFTPINGPPVNAATVHDSVAGAAIREGHRSATDPGMLAVQQARSVGASTSRPSRHDIRLSAERCAQVNGQSSTNSRSKCQKTKCNTAKAASSNRRLGPSLVTSPPFASSTGFRYRKAGAEPSKNTGAKKCMLDPISVASAPIVSGRETCLDASTQGRADAAGSGRRDIYEVPLEPQDGLDQQSFRTSRNSGYSTQAAMILAQLEFQEGAASPIASDTLDPWPRVQDETPQPDPSYTPFHAFNAQLDKQHPPDSMSRVVPINTQDLFDAASPFSFGTAMKKSSIRQASSIRVPILGNRGREGGVESPTPSERVPLKERNSKGTVLHSTASEKGSQEVSKAAELPQLGLCTSLDSLGPNNDLSFADEFLRRVRDTL